MASASTFPLSGVNRQPSLQAATPLIRVGNGKPDDQRYDYRGSYVAPAYYAGSQAGLGSYPKGLLRPFEKQGIERRQRFLRPDPDVRMIGRAPAGAVGDVDVASGVMSGNFWDILQVQRSAPMQGASLNDMTSYTTTTRNQSWDPRGDIPNPVGAPPPGASWSTYGPYAVGKERRMFV